MCCRRRLRRLSGHAGTTTAGAPSHQVNPVVVAFHGCDYRRPVPPDMAAVHQVRPQRRHARIPVNGPHQKTSTSDATH
jgi:hypothetical protein